MKKSQVLAALALAFALGVAVIPASSTYAYVVDANDKLITNASVITDLNTAIADAKKIKTAEEYAEYAALIEAVNGDAEVSIDGTDTTLNTVIDGQKAALLAALQTANSIDPTDYEDATYTTVYNLAVNNRKSAQDIHGASSTPYTTLNGAINAADEAIEEAEIATVTALQTALAGTGWTGGDYIVKTYVTTDDDGVETADFTGAVAYAKSKASQYNFYNNLVTAVKKAEDVVGAQANTEKYTVAQAEKVLATLKVAMEGKTTVVDDNNNGNSTNNGSNSSDSTTAQDPSAPDTGVLSDAEASASTTVAMVAGIATALTAAGAGVVAYRNARRSTRK